MKFLSRPERSWTLLRISRYLVSPRGLHKPRLQYLGDKESWTKISATRWKTLIGGRWLGILLWSFNNHPRVRWRRLVNENVSTRQRRSGCGITLNQTG